ncbi:non-ribosomal peptide synthetase [Nocardiopsis dassonvillei]|uniref:non-ribosomal peptide synthetase n=1 Tax=Nocardiopsis dassonvillei TaxID=2014 RepID=UPI00200F2EEE|nr:non-ribosomal peptide synthetase [Nocardiopsis dassonvillei]MCK9870296.1 non-ribosomal peptide synthetase [Nocardiopsis dassonvillei]
MTSAEPHRAGVLTSGDRPGHTGWSVLTEIADQVRAGAGACAVRSAGEKVTYKELWEQAGRVAAVVSAAASGSGQPRVAIGVGPGADWVGCLLGVWRAGAVAVPVNLDHPPARLRLLADSADLLVHAAGAVPGWWPNSKPATALPGPEAGVLPEPGPKDAVDAGGGTACILHTSGSTGAPKPVVLAHSGLARRITDFADLYRITARDRIAQLAAASVDVVLWETLLAMTTGATLCIPHSRQRVPGIGLVRWLVGEQVTVATMTPTMLVALPELTLPELRLLVVGGEALAPARFRYWIDRHQVANAYGPTEATIATHVALHITADDHPAPLGRPVPGVEDFLLDENDQPVPDGQTGHLHLAGAGLADGYAGLTERTAHAFPTLMIGGRAVRVYRTGDRAWRRPDGQLTYAGRIDRQLNLGGVRLEPEEVEAVALALDGVTAAVALAEPAQGRDVLALHAAVPGGRITRATLRAHLADRLPSTAIPHRIHLHPSLPLTGYGKPDVQALAALALPGAPLTAEPGGTSPTADSPAVALPKAVRVWWQQATGAEPATATTDFFACGGDSLACIELLHRINETFGLEIPLVAFTAEPTPAFLARALACTTQELA